MNIKHLELPSTDRLNEAIEYDAKTGILWWKPRPEMGKSWNTQNAGKKCGGRGKGREGKQYLNVPFDGKKYKGHRIAWKIFYGCDPVGEVDHINGDSLDNRIENLRVVTHAENCRNIKSTKRNSRSGHLGVFWNEQRQSWSVGIGHNMKKHYLGDFDDLFSAVAARKSAENRLGFHENHRLIVGEKSNA